MELILERLEKNTLPLPKFATAESAGLDFAACLTRLICLPEPDKYLKRTDKYQAQEDLETNIISGGWQLAISPNAIVKIPLGFKCQFLDNPSGFKSQFQENHHLQLHIRSSLGMRGLVLANTVGIIDADYRGELIACVRNLSTDTLYIGHGDRIVQGILVKNLQPTVVEGTVNTTARGEGGFGSTGNKA